MTLFLFPPIVTLLSTRPVHQNFEKAWPRRWSFRPENHQVGANPTFVRFYWVPLRRRALEESSDGNTPRNRLFHLLQCKHQNAVGELRTDAGLIDLVGQ